MRDDTAALRIQVGRLVAHWRGALVALDDIENFATALAWRSLEAQVGVAIRERLGEAVARLRRQSDVLEAEYRAAETAPELEAVRRRVLRFRRQYLQVETALDFYGDAVNTRTNPKLAALLSACDLIAKRSLEIVLTPLNKPVAPVLTYIDKGLGASILRSGLRLWDGRTLSAAAAIKLTRQNLLRPTACLHESAHQASHTLGWNEELSEGLRRGLDDDPTVADQWAAWSSEIAADAIAFCCSGYATTAALADVIEGEGEGVFALRPGDPHPVAYLRGLLGWSFSSRWYGRVGPWSDAAAAWMQTHPLDDAPVGLRGFLERSVALLPRIVETILVRPYRAFEGRPLTSIVDPSRVSPQALLQLEREAGPALYLSTHWLWTESLRLLALSGLRAATEPDRAPEIAERFETWMLRLGRSVQAAA